MKLCQNIALKDIKIEFSTHRQEFKLARELRHLLLK